jgi:hypothetical protein
MDVRRGILRLWLVASAAWIAWTLWQSDVSCPLTAIGIAVPNDPWCKDPLVDPIAYYSDLVVKALGPPVSAAILWFAALWISAGFRSRDAR